MTYSDEYWEDIDEVLKVNSFDAIKNKSVLVTGASGLIGSSVTDILFHLNKKYNYKIKIYLAGRNASRINQRFYIFEPEKDFHYIYFDATKEQDIELHVDYVINCAGNSSPRMYSEQPVETMLANIVGVNTLNSMAYMNQISRILYVSSSEVYGEKQNDELYIEEELGTIDVLNPRACYPSSKRAAETLCAAYMQEHALDFVIVRPGHIYGPQVIDSDNRASAQFSREAKAGRNIIMKSEGRQVRSYCYSLDCASAILYVLLCGKLGSAYNISNPQSVISIRELATCLADKAGVAIQFEIPTMTEKSGYTMMKNSALSSDKIEKLGWVPCFDVNAGVDRTLKYL